MKSEDFVLNNKVLLQVKSLSVNPEPFAEPFT